MTNVFAGIMIKEGGNPLIRGCKLHHGKAEGIYVYENGLGIVEDCGIYGNTFAGVLISKGGNPTLRGCKLHGGKMYGLSIFGKEQVDDCEIMVIVKRGCISVKKVIL